MARRINFGATQPQTGGRGSGFRFGQRRFTTPRFGQVTVSNFSKDLEDFFNFYYTQWDIVINLYWRSNWRTIIDQIVGVRYFTQKELTDRGHPYSIRKPRNSFALIDNIINRQTGDYQRSFSAKIDRSAWPSGDIVAVILNSSKVPKGYSKNAILLNGFSYIRRVGKRKNKEGARVGPGRPKRIGMRPRRANSQFGKIFGERVWPKMIQAARTRIRKWKTNRDTGGQLSPSRLT